MRDRNAVLCGARKIPSQQPEESGVEVPVGDRSNMREPGHPGLRGFDQLKRAIDLAERPQGKRQIEHCANARIVPEAKSLIAVALGIEQAQRPLEMIAGLGIFAGGEVRYAGYALGDAGFRLIPLAPDLAQKRGGVRTHIG